MEGTESATPREDPGKPGLGRRVGSSLLSMLLATGVLRVLSFGSQLVLGYLLALSDFGVFAIATSIWALIQVMRDGGGRNLLVQMGPEAWAENSGPMFWMALIFNLATGLGLALLAPVFAWAYDDARLLPMLLVLAASVPLSTPSVILTARLRIDLRFGALARLRVLAGVVRFGGTIALATAWAGTEIAAMSFVVPMLAVAIVENLYTLALVRDRPWRGSPGTERWASYFRDGKWLILAALGNVSIRLGPHAVIGFLVTKPILGVFFFAFQIVGQTGQMFGQNIEAVLLPTFSRLKDDAERFARATYRSIRALSILAIPMTFTIASIYPALEEFAWGEKWRASILPVEVLTFGYALFTLLVLPRTLLVASGRFRASAFAMVGTGLGLMLACGLGALYRPTALSIAFASTIYMTVAITAVGGISIRLLGLSLLRAVMSVATVLAITVVTWLGLRLLDGQVLLDTAPSLRLAVMVLAAPVAYLIALRALSGDGLRDACDVAPVRLGRLVRRLLFLGDAGEDSLRSMGAEP